jgi:uncharacterized repeat protein (TIGR01451 family)
MSVVVRVALILVAGAGIADAQDPVFALADKIGPVGSLEPDAHFGSSVAVDGDRAVVGAPGTNSAFVFVNTPDGWELEAVLEPPPYGGAAFDVEYRTFGHSVAIENDVIVVGAPRSRISNGSFWYEEGAGCVFRRSVAGVWVLEHQLMVWNASYLGDTHYGSSVAISGDTIIGGAPDDTRFGEPNESGSAFVFRYAAGSWYFEQRLTSSFQIAEDHFGAAVDIDGDTAVVGAPDREILLSTDAGRAYVFNRSGTSWSQVTDLVAGDPGIFDHFGSAVSVAGSRILVGSPDDDHTGGTDAGSSYLFLGSGSSWNQAAKLTAGDADAGDRFGAAVAVSASDGALIGAPEDNLGMLDIDAGSAYFFKPVTTVWTEDQKIVHAETAISDLFGSAVALDGAVAFVGAPMDDVRTIDNTGSAHLFHHDGLVWNHETGVVGEWGFGLFDQHFGRAIAVDTTTLVVGVPESEWRSAQVFNRDGDEWVLEQELLSAQGSVLDDHFGYAVDVSADTVVVGAPWGAAMGHDFAGRVYVYVRTSTITGLVWELQQLLEASDAAPQSTFGSSVAVEGDTLVVGAPGRDANEGGVYFFTRSGTVWAEDAVLSPSWLESNDKFGHSISLDGDELAIGATGDDDAGTDAGAVVLYDRAGSVWTEGQKLTAPSPQTARLGHSIARDGTTMVVGAIGTEVSGHAAAGSAHVFVESAGTWSEQQMLTAASPGTNDWFGVGAAISGDVIAIGASGWDFFSLLNAGNAIIFQRSGSLWSQTQVLIGLPVKVNARFGDDVAATPDGFVVAACYEDYLPAGLGAVYFYTGSFDRADLAVTVTDHQSGAVPGTTVSYDVTVTNNGPDDALGATVTDIFPQQLSGCSWTCTGTDATCTAGPVIGDISDTVDILVSGEAIYTATCSVDPAATGDLVNSASVTPPAGVADPNLADNSAIDTDTLTPLADLSIVKDNGTDQVVPGQQTTYSIVVSNAGPSDAPGSPVIDLFPASLSDCSWTCTADPGAWCSPGSTGDIDNGVDLSVGTSATFLATCTVAGANGQIINTANVLAQAANGVTDPDPLNNESTDIDDVVPPSPLIFADDFEGGDTSAWSVTVP